MASCSSVARIRPENDTATATARESRIIMSEQQVSISPLGRMLKHWRGVRRCSQLDLALQANVSARHVSFIETGRAKPSREMVLQLAEVLDVPLREQNAMLHAAGYAAQYHETGLDEPSMEQVRSALEQLLAALEPAGAIVIDRHWDVLMTNAGMASLLGYLFSGPPPALGGDGPVNSYRLAMHGDGLKPYIVNWQEMARHLIHRLHREALVEGPDGHIQALLDEILGYPDVPREWATPDFERPAGPVLALHLRKDDTDLRLFTTITTFGTAQDVTLQELRIETFHPADEPTAALLRSLTAPS